MKVRRLRRRYGRARKYGSVSVGGYKRKLKGWKVYRGYTLDPWRGARVEHSRATWKVQVHKGSGPGSMVGYEFGASEAEAFAKAKRLVDAMEGD